MMGGNMTLRRRLEKLEAKLGGTMPEPLVMMFHVLPARAEVKVTGCEIHDSPARFAIIGAGQYGESANLRIHDKESETAFLARVEAETKRIHGRLPVDWNPT